MFLPWKIKCRQALQWLLPFTCLLCRQPSDQQQDLCSACRRDLPDWHEQQACPVCGRLRLPAGTDLPCGRCLAKPPPFQATHVLFRYEKPLPQLLTRLKFHRQLLPARVLGELMSERIRTAWYREKSLPEAIIPVPLHPKRMTERGYNQTVELARPVGKSLGLPLWLNAVARVRPTLPQTSLSAAARRQNVQQAFAVTGAVRGRHVAVLEDVVTTGSTLAALCQSLARQGTGRIDIWCCAMGVRCV